MPIIGGGSGGGAVGSAVDELDAPGVGPGSMTTGSTGPFSLFRIRFREPGAGGD